MITREQFRNMIGQVRGNGSTPDEPLLSVFDALTARVRELEQRNDKLTMDRDVFSGENAELLDNLSLCKGNELAAQVDALTQAHQQAVEALKQLATAVNEERLLVIGSEEWCVVASKMYDLATLATHKEKG